MPRRLLFRTCAMVVVDTLYCTAIVLLIPLLAEEFGLSKAAIGVLSGAFGAGAFLGSRFYIHGRPFRAPSVANPYSLRTLAIVTDADPMTEKRP
jgi:hypothetical protein